MPPVTFTRLDLKRSLRAGRYVWPGGYEKFYVCDDGGTLCDPCVRANWREVVTAMFMKAHGARNTGWAIEGVDTTDWSEDDVICDHCNSNLTQERTA